MSQTHWEFDVYSSTWSALLNILLKKHPPQFQSDIVVDYLPDHTHWQIPRALVPVDELAKTLGVTSEAILSKRNIILRPFKAEADWQQPTISDWGTA